MKAFLDDNSFLPYELEGFATDLNHIITGKFHKIFCTKYHRTIDYQKAKESMK